MQSFFQDKFLYDLHANRMLISKLEAQEDNLNDYLLRSMSHILNVHYLWNCRLLAQKVESEVWDILPLSYFHKFNESNYLNTISYIDSIHEENKIEYHDSEAVLMEKSDRDILYHLLNHASYHRGQIVLAMKQNNLQTPSFNFISMR